MAALKKLKEAAALVLLNDQPSRVALLRLPLSPSISLLSKPCIPPALGPRPTEAPCSLPPCRTDNYHRGRRYSQKNRHDVREFESVGHTSNSSNGKGLPNLALAGAVSVYQWTNGISALTRDLLRFGSSSRTQVEFEHDCKITTPPPDITSGRSFDLQPSTIDRYHALLLQLLQDTSHGEHHSQSSLSTSFSPSTCTSTDFVVQQFHSINVDQGERPFSAAVVLQQADRLEHAREPPTSPTAGERQKDRPQGTQGHSQKQVERRGEEQPEGRGRREKWLPSDKATPAQMSVILLKLREELPAFFDGHHSYDIYDANMKFENNLPPQGWSTDSRRSYRMFLESSRFALKLSFSQTSLDLIKITKDVDQGKIEARWRVRGRPRYFLSLRERVLVDGFSTFLVNSSGLISLHRMDRVMPAPTKEKLRSLWRVWLGRLVGVASPKSPLPQPELVSSSKPT